MTTTSPTTTSPTTTSSPTVATDPVGRFLAAIESGNGIPAALFAPEVVLDATVPGWRFTTNGADAVSQELGRWYADAGHLDELERTPVEGGELVELLLSWVEDGVPHAAHQIHRLAIDGDVIRGDRVWCGGRWSETLLEQMRAANMATSS